MAFIFFCLFMVGIFVVFYYHLHFLVVLLGLEIMLFSLFVLYCVVYLKMLVGYGVFIYLLVLVCMGGYGVSLLVSVTRSVGKDFCMLGFYS